MLLLPPRSTLFPYTTLFRSFPSRRPVARAVRLRGRAAMRPGREEAVLPCLSRQRRVDLRHDGLRFPRSEEHTSELQSLRHLVCRLLLEKKKTKRHASNNTND